MTHLTDGDRGDRLRSPPAALKIKTDGWSGAIKQKSEKSQRTRGSA